MALFERPEGILKCMPVEWVKKLGCSIEKYGERWTARNDIPGYYCMFNLSSKPTADILYFYLAFSGAVRLRANVIGYEKEGDLLCWDGKYHHGKCWVQIAAPFVVAEEPISVTELFGKKGFQGFRYVEKLF